MGFLGVQNPDAKFKIMNPVPVGHWMKGSVLQTGYGLLYATSSGKYFSVEAKNGISLLTEYTGRGISERSDIELGALIASAKVCPSEE